MIYFFPVTLAYAEGGAAPAAAGFASMVPLLILFAIFYFLLIRPQQKKAKEHNDMVARLQKGDNVITNGGLHGRVTSVGDETVTVEVADGVRVKVTRDAVAARKPTPST
ncbi:MAG: preprotein translocase subunit YajC [Thermodesulfobacteriota bacterium]